MHLLSYSGYRFPPDIIQRAVWMYLRFTLSFRDVEELWPSGASRSPTRVSGVGCSPSVQRSPAGCGPDARGRTDAGTSTRWPSVSAAHFARSGTATRTQAARVQVAPVSPAFPVHARGHLQHFHRSSSSRLCSHSPPLSSGGVRGLAQCGRCPGLTAADVQLVAPALDNVTPPAPACLVGLLPAAGPGGVRASLRRIAGCATPTRSAGHALGSAQTDRELTFNPDHPTGADHP
jgi:hypothetical protein